MQCSAIRALIATRESSSFMEERMSSRPDAIDQKIDQQGHGPSGAAFLGAAEPGGTRDVKMRPLQILGEFPEERSGGGGAALASTDIGDVREIAFQLIDVFLADRQPPGAVVGADARGFQFIRQ